MTSPPLAELQAWMHGALVHPGSADPAEADEILLSSPRLTGAERLAIYQRSYYARILACMREQFPALCHALGEGLFTDFAREYLEACPPDSYTLYDLGRRFPDHLEGSRPDHAEPAEQREGWIDFMVDLARFERRLFELFDAPGHEGRPFATHDTPDHLLRLQPCFALGDYRFPVARYYHDVSRRADPPAPPRRRSPVAMVRTDFRTHTYPVSPPQHAFLATLLDGWAVAAALAAVAAGTGMPLGDVQASWSDPHGTRRRWIAAGFFVGDG